MSAEDDAGEKEHEPTQKRLEDARKRGEIPRSQDITTAAGYAGLLLAGVTFGSAALKRIAGAGQILLEQPDRLSRLFASSAHAPTGGLMAAVTLAALPIVLLPAGAVILSLVAQRAVVFTPEKLMPKLSRISPLATAKNRFGRSGLFEFAKSLAKLVVISVVLGMFLVGHMGEILGTLSLSPAMATVMLLQLLMRFLFLVLLVAMSIGAIDQIWQRSEHARRNRMSRKDLQDEHKESEGDPHAKQARRQRGYDIAMNRMLADVPKADVVIVNPTHYAVALKWNRSDRHAPICVAKGVDEVAARIRAAASEAGVPLHSDPPTARALHSSVEIGEEILPEQYKPVAAAIRFAEEMRAKARGRWRP